ncbi:LOW QUALITY PROTEIN: hypothetical protein CVT26_010888 [Gymnopilus dilepis]|uniref:Uncharacterized protein n=1 Tax=Gymnopilus dilepis TaxID=231916 RepID=A0A409VIU8_9AGAR|nr:LOW QUALITY PROTEIN: hypothetical protein CVT26_010888 [Gymnopilus dilepis]
MSGSRTSRMRPTLSSIPIKSAQGLQVLQWQSGTAAAPGPELVDSSWTSNHRISVTSRKKASVCSAHERYPRHLFSSIHIRAPPSLSVLMEILKRYDDSCLFLRRGLFAGWSKFQRNAQYPDKISQESSASTSHVLKLVSGWPVFSPSYCKCSLASTVSTESLLDLTPDSDVTAITNNPTLSEFYSIVEPLAGGFELRVDSPALKLSGGCGSSENSDLEML